MPSHPTDAQLARWASEYQDLRDQMKQLEERRNRISANICTEMERRGTKAIEHNGLRITYVQQERVTYDVDGLRRELTPTVFRRITSPVVDKTKLLEALSRGTVDPDVVETCATTTYSKPYPAISGSNGD